MTRSISLAALTAVLALTACKDDPPPQSFPTVGWTASATKVGPLHTGMTTDEVLRALGLPDAGPIDSSSACNYVDTRLSAHAIGVMVEQGAVVRIEVRDSSVATEAGARVGDTEARIMSLYPNAEVKPHKYYTDGHYLVVGDETNQMIFETDGKHVMNYRVGRTPAVAYVEGCS